MDKPKLTLVTSINQQNPAVIAEIKEVLEKAEKGEITAIAMVYQYPTLEMGFTAAFSNNSMPAAIVGELEVLQQLIISKHCAK